MLFAINNEVIHQRCIRHQCKERTLLKPNHCTIHESGPRNWMDLTVKEKWEKSAFAKERKMALFDASSIYCNWFLTSFLPFRIFWGHFISKYMTFEVVFHSNWYFQTKLDRELLGKNRFALVRNTWWWLISETIIHFQGADMKSILWKGNRAGFTNRIAGNHKVIVIWKNEYESIQRLKISWKLKIARSDNSFFP